MKVHTITVKESEWEGSKYQTKEWEKRVKIVRWEHDYEGKTYQIQIQIK